MSFILFSFLYVVLNPAAAFYHYLKILSNPEDEWRVSFDKRINCCFNPTTLFLFKFQQYILHKRLWRLRYKKYTLTFPIYTAFCRNVCAISWEEKSIRMKCSKCVSAWITFILLFWSRCKKLIVICYLSNGNYTI